MSSVATFLNAEETLYAGTRAGMELTPLALCTYIAANSFKRIINQRLPGGYSTLASGGYTKVGAK